jgi:hypothetical protein
MVDQLGGIPGPSQARVRWETNTFFCNQLARFLLNRLEIQQLNDYERDPEVDIHVVPGHPARIECACQQ